MDSKNNGKIVIAIVAMLVVAISIVGVTYAYFSADVVGNTTNKSVEVQAGILEIEYTSGNEMIAKNIVPGWESDGEHYYDPTGSVYTAQDSEGNDVKAVKAITQDDCDTEGINCSIETPTTDNGITDAVTFSVANTSRNTGTTYYSIELVNVENGIVDTANLDYELYSVTTKDATTGGTLLSSGDLVTTGSQVIVKAAESIKDGGAEKYYYLKLKYANIDGEQNSSMGKTVKATVKVVGITNIGTVENPIWSNGEDPEEYTFAS